MVMINKQHECVKILYFCDISEKVSSEEKSNITTRFTKLKKSQTNRNRKERQVSQGELTQKLNEKQYQEINK
jgi:hypothetical protein